MTRTLAQLKGDFVVLDLGSAHADGLYRQRPGFAEAITLIEIDAQLDSSGAGPANPNRICLGKAVAGHAGRRSFKLRKFPECSSFLEPKHDLIAAYGLESYFIEAKTLQFECETIGELLKQRRIERVDFFKTDLEGLDLEVLSSAPDLVRNALCIQSELRFQPFYEGEPAFHEVSAFLDDHGFELVSLRPQIWKYATPSRPFQRDGRTVWADSIFFLREEEVHRRFGAGAWKPMAKQIILARLLGLSNYAEHLLMRNESAFAEDVRTELAAFSRPDFSLSARVASALNRLPLGWGILGLGRRFFGNAFRAFSVYRDEHVADV